MLLLLLVLLLLGAAGVSGSAPLLSALASSRQLCAMAANLARLTRMCCSGSCRVGKICSTTYSSSQRHKRQDSHAFDDTSHLLLIELPAHLTAAAGLHCNPHPNLQQVQGRNGQHVQRSSPPIPSCTLTCASLSHRGPAT